MNSPASALSAPGTFAVRTHTFEARDPARDRLFSCDIWCPDEPGAWPLVLYSHHSRGSRRSATYLTTHLASHGYLVAALDHSEVVAPEVAGNVQGLIANRVPDARFLLDYMLAGAIPCTARPDPDRIAIVGHSAAGWTAVALPEPDTRIRAVVELPPAERPIPSQESSPPPSVSTGRARRPPYTSSPRTTSSLPSPACTSSTATLPGPSKWWSSPAPTTCISWTTLSRPMSSSAPPASRPRPPGFHAKCAPSPSSAPEKKPTVRSKATPSPTSAALSPAASPPSSLNTDRSCDSSRRLRRWQDLASLGCRPKP